MVKVIDPLSEHSTEVERNNHMYEINFGLETVQEFMVGYLKLNHLHPGEDVLPCRIRNPNIMWEKNSLE